MKIRLVKLGTGEYEVQERFSFFHCWERWDIFTELNNAISCYDNRVQCHTNKKKRKIVVEILREITI